ncbi:MAG TPA: pirin family protein [Steroidobacteraceae bacterium]
MTEGGASEASIESVIEARRRDLGGFEVGRVLPWRNRRMVGPFIFFDHIGPVTLSPGLPKSADIRPHPHIGLATITYLFAGEMVHRDSLGCTQVIRPGEVNWMTAGRGISHSERFETMRERGGFLHGIQAWVALPDEHEETAPSFAHFDGPQLPRGELDGVRFTVIAGSVLGLTSPVQTLSPLAYAHFEIPRGARIEIPCKHRERAVFIAKGSVAIDGALHEVGKMPVFAPGATLSLAAPEDSTVMLLAGQPLGERHIWWNFVSSRRERIEQAKADWRAGRIELPVDDRDEFIPLPEEPEPKPEPLS